MFPASGSGGGGERGCGGRGVWCVLLWGGGTRACLSGGLWGARGNEFVITDNHCMAEHPVYGEHQLRGAILDAWGNIGYV
jgi:hypothetical protein